MIEEGQFIGFNMQSIFYGQRCVVLLVVAVSICRINNQNIVKKISIFMNSILLENDTMKKFFWSSNIDKLIISLLYLP